MSATDILTFGCRLNAFESEVMRGHAAATGLEDAVIVNSCAVTAEAERQVRQSIRRARRENPDARIIVTGCAAQTEPETFAAMEEVDAVIGNTEKMQGETWGRLAADFIGDAERVLASTGSLFPLRDGKFCVFHKTIVDWLTGETEGSGSLASGSVVSGSGSETSCSGSDVSAPPSVDQVGFQRSC